MSNQLPTPGPIVLRSQSIYHCNWLLSIASRTAQRCSELAAKNSDRDGTEEKTDDAISCILLAAAAAEAFINELSSALSNYVQERGGSGDSKVVAAAWTLKQIENMQGKTAFKFEMAILSLTGQPPDTGSAVFQNFALLFKLRNDLMHVKRPSTIGIVDDSESTPIPSAVMELRKRGLTRRTPEGHRTHWISHLMTVRVAEWACEAASEICVFIARQVPVRSIAESFELYMTDDESKPLVGNS